MKENSFSAPYGILLVDKIKGITSHDVVDIMRERLKIRRIGHTGTLDPLATGLLIILVGKSTSLQEKFQKMNKVYEGKILFGVETDTWDITGKIIRNLDIELKEDSVNKAISILNGNITQIVPPYSAVKYKGQTLYKLARKNKALPLLNRRVNLRWIDYKFDKKNLYFKIECSSGTYIRSIAHQMGILLGCGGVVSELRRLKIGDYSVEEAISVDKIKKMTYTDLLKLLK